MSSAARVDALKDWVIVTELWRERLLERAYQARRCAVRATCCGRIERSLDRLDAARRYLDVADWYRRRIWAAVREVRRLESGREVRS